MAAANLLQGEGQLPGRSRLLASLQLPVGPPEELVLTRVGWEDLLDRNPAFGHEDIVRLRQELRVNPTAEDYRRLTRLLYRLSRPETAERTAHEAVSLCLRQIEASPRSASLHRELGLAWVSLGAYGQAADALGKSLELGERSPEGYAAYAMACLSVGQLETARTAIARGRDLFPTRPEIHVASHSVLLNANGQSPGGLVEALRAPRPEALLDFLAVEDLRAAVESDPAYLSARRTLAEVLIDSVQERARRQTGILCSWHDLRALKTDLVLLDEAISHLEYVLEWDALAPAQVVWYRAVAARLSGHLEEASEWATRAAQISFERPRAGDARFRASYLAWLIERGELEAVRTFLKQDEARIPLLEDFPLRAACYWKLGQTDQAELWAQRLVISLPGPLDPDERYLRAAAHTVLGAVSLSRSQDDRAEEEFLEARRWSPRYPATAWGLALSRALQGRSAEAIEALRPVAGLFRPKGPDLDLLAVLAGEEEARRMAETNHQEVSQRDIPSLPASQVLDRGLDWLLGYLAFWRTAGPFRASEMAASQRERARRGIEALTREWERPDFPEPKMDLLAAARFLAGLEPNEESRTQMLASLRRISQQELSRISFPAGPPSGVSSGGLSGPFAAAPAMDSWARAMTIGCDGPLEQAHALAAWLTLRPRLDFSSARTVEESFQLLNSNPRARFTPDENAALFIAAARAAGLKAGFALMPRLPSVELSTVSAAGVLVERGLLLVAPGLRVFGGVSPDAVPLAEEEAASLFNALRAGPDRVERCRQAAQDFPRSGRIRIALAEALVTESSVSGDAAVQAQAAVQMAPDLPEAHLLLGAAQESLGKAREADAAFRHAARLSPGSEKGHHVRGLAFLRLGRLADAAREFRTALEILPYGLDDRLFYAMCLYQTGSKIEAMEEARRILLQNDSQQEIRKLLIDLLIEQEKSQELVLELEELLAAQPDNDQARRFLRELYAGAGMEAEAQSLQDQPRK
ncbi:MAG: hypothetical protein HYU36_23050 [Planctomycetes bacterium]|nr:hypothetical protein [Planctomycetota bacterium]